MEQIELIDEADAAALVGVAPKTLRNWRASRINLPFYKAKGFVFYNKQEVITFRDQQPVEQMGVAS